MADLLCVHDLPIAIAAIESFIQIKQNQDVRLSIQFMVRAQRMHAAQALPRQPVVVLLVSQAWHL